MLMVDCSGDNPAGFLPLVILSTKDRTWRFMANYTYVYK